MVRSICQMPLLCLGSSDDWKHNLFCNSETSRRARKENLILLPLLSKGAQDAWRKGVYLWRCSQGSDVSQACQWVGSSGARIRIHVQRFEVGGRRARRCDWTGCTSGSGSHEEFFRSRLVNWLEMWIPGPNPPACPLQIRDGARYIWLSLTVWVPLPWEWKHWQG